MRTLKFVKATPEQLPILAEARPGFRLIRGAAGSGKTTTALLRLRQLCASRMMRRSRLGVAEPVRVLVLTFNRTLRGYINQLAHEQVVGHSGLEMTIDTFSRWAMGLVGRPRVVDDARFLIQQALRSAGQTHDMDYFVDEVQYVLGRFKPTQRSMYFDAIRSGRGRTPTVARSLRTKLLDEVIPSYQEAKGRDQCDWHDIALMASQATSAGYDIVVVDETQDLSANQIRAILAHLREDHSTTFIIDAIQRIYPQSFTWRELGISMLPQMVYSLRQNHRNTKEIARLAASLTKDLPPDDDGVSPDPEACDRSGPKPRMLVGKYGAQLAHMLQQVGSRSDANETVAILQPKGGRWFDHARRALRERRIAFCELTRNREWPDGPEQVALSTIHSAKGLEFDHVLLPGLSREVTPHGAEAGDGTLEGLRRLLAMAVTRAGSTVTLGYKRGEASTLIDLIDPTTYDRIEV